MSDTDVFLELSVLYGPFIVGMMIGSTTPRLFGITLSQTVVYFRQYPDDKPLLKGLVWLSLILDTFHLVMVSENVHFWYIYCRLPERYEGLPSFHWALGASIIGTYLITSAVQCLYILRVAALNGNKVVVCALSILSVLQLVFGFVLWGDLTVAKSLAAVHGTLGQIGGSIELAATTDWIRKDRECGEQTHLIHREHWLPHQVTRPSMWAYRDLSCASSLTLILWLVLPENFVFITFTLIRSKLYVNSMLVTLNFRKAARQALDSSRQTGITTSKFYQDLDIDDRVDIELSTMSLSSAGRSTLVNNQRA
ncbi:hypothetical protein BDN71DRAFT_1507507 [Pleurotus eryngii]|uniref:DUF6534 domain-containing protein n=1 Tax=Pleurotus eryngii TaxID=5323 RepID=A0A9P5ZWA7_PLEER|nr:hypothetical protein BDN71DRAFT_1507507 [Pleurotus eryngii]